MSDESHTSVGGSSNGTPTHTPSPSTELPPSLRPSSSRALVPTPITTNNTQKTIATASSPTSDHAISPMGGGPTSAAYVIPPRPKPGRKPATDEPASKRKAQNRESQRAFRARKAAKVSELQQQVDTTEQKHRKDLSDKISELNQRDITIRDLNAKVSQVQETNKRTASELNYWKDRATQLEAQNSQLIQQLKARGGSIPSFHNAPFFSVALPPSRQDSPRGSISSFTSYSTPKPIDIGCGNCKDNGECPCIEEIAKIPTPTSSFMPTIPLVPELPHATVSSMKGMHTPPMDPSSTMFAEREIDFTAQFSTKRPRLDTRPSIAFLTQSNEPDSRCGFCTDESNCLCKDQSLQSFNNDHVTVSRDERCASKSRPEPGTCEDCQVNPRQRAWCLRVAQLRGSGKNSTSSPSSPRIASIGSMMDSHAPLLPRSERFSIGCNDTFKLLDGRFSMEADKMDWVSNLQPVPPNTITRLPTLEPQRSYSALELDTASVIATLQQSMAPIIPRPSDEPNSDIVRIARETQLPR